MVMQPIQMKQNPMKIKRNAKYWQATSYQLACTTVRQFFCCCFFFQFKKEMDYKIHLTKNVLR